MSPGPDRYIIRECAQEIIAVLNERGEDPSRLSDGLLAATRTLLDHPALTGLGARRQGNFVSNSKYLYYDGQLEITLNQMPIDRQFPPHDHGTCEALIIYSGQLSHTVYERVDDRQREGYAELRIVDDRVLTRGDIALMMPPVEIHSFRALTDDTFVLTVVEGRYKPERHFYCPENRTYSINAPQAVKER